MTAGKTQNHTHGNTSLALVDRRRRFCNAWYPAPIFETCKINLTQLAVDRRARPHDEHGVHDAGQMRAMRVREEKTRAGCYSVCVGVGASCRANHNSGSGYRQRLACEQSFGEIRAANICPLSAASFTRSGRRSPRSISPNASAAANAPHSSTSRASVTHRLVRSWSSSMKSAADAAHSSGDGLGIQQPGSMTWGDRLAMPAPSGRARDRAICPAVARNLFPNCVGGAAAARRSHKPNPAPQPVGGCHE